MTSSRRSAALRALRFGSVYWRAALGSTYALTIGIGTRRNRGLLTDIARHFGYDHRDREPALPRVSLNDIVRPGSRPDLRELEGVDGNVSVLELVVLATTTARLGARTVFEIGTFDGRTAVNLAANAAPGAVVFTLDLPLKSGDPALDVDIDDRKYMQPSRSGSRIASSELATRIHRLFGDSATFDFTPYAGTVDLCFIDGSHAYSYVRNDSARALEMLRPGGVILWHDYSTWPGVTQALDELHHTDPAFAGLRWIEGTTLAVLQSDAMTPVAGQ
ncbi:MAG TPA: class I SAM-dependent methyltransferase [Gemmatimonadaceae bacterium]